MTIKDLTIQFFINTFQGTVRSVAVVVAYRHFIDGAFLLTILSAAIVETDY